jgi:4-diphosphocytidyl-2-C-methyl-D-erythritol kinase
LIGAGFAPAKVNLFLHVGPVRPDGFHPIVSLMAFADIGDELRCEPSRGLQLKLIGPTAGHAPPGEDNLVLRAAKALFAHAGVPEPDLRLILEKRLPAEAGLGGGSSDAAAALRILNEVLGLRRPTSDLQEIAAALGSDIPACVLAEAVIARGRGEELWSAPRLPRLPAVLARPPVAASTAAVYRAFDADSPLGAIEPSDIPASFGSPEAVAKWLALQRNDLQAPAVSLQPRIGEAIAILEASPEALLGRMSGSGSACFALCADDAAAASLAGRLAREHPDWWVQCCALGGTAV